MKNFLTLVVICALSFQSYGQVVNIPDPNFKQALIDANTDTNGDGEIQQSEARAITSLDLAFKNISDLQGIEEFINLTQLNCENNEIAELHLGDHAELIELNASFNPLIVFDFNSINNIQRITLNAVELEVIELSDLNSLLELRLTHISGAGEVQLTKLPNLKTLVCHDCEFVNNDFSGFASLVYVEIVGLAPSNVFDEFVLGNLDSLEFLTIDLASGVLERVELYNLPSLQSLYIFTHTMRELTIRDVPKLEHIDNLIDYPDLSLLILENLQSLQAMDLHNNSLEFLSMSNLPSLQYFSYMAGFLEVIDLRGFPSLENIDVHDGGGSLRSIYIKDGRTSNFFTDVNLYPDGLYICGDQEEIDRIREEIMNHDPDGTLLEAFNLSTDCSYLPNEGINLIRGTAKIDIDNNGCDDQDPEMEGVKITQDGNNFSDIVFTNSIGNYRQYVEDGLHHFEVEVENPNYYSWTPASFDLEFPFDTNIVEQDICIIPNGSYKDLRVRISPVDVLRPGFESDFLVKCKNVGTEILSGYAELRYTDLYTDYVASLPEGVDEGGKIVWEFENLLPQEEIEYLVTLRFNSPMDDPPLNGDDAVDLGASIFPVLEDVKPSNNVHIIKPILVNSYDPNDKTCLQGKEITPEMVGEYVDYLIRFENTGTAEAVNVVVRDRIDTNVFELNTLTIIDASHKMETRIVDGNLVEFIFEEIYLPFDDANNDGHISFSIKTKDDLVLGDKLENTAEIYFDFNWPIITNTAMTEVREPVFVGEVDENIDLSISPNPTADLILIESSSLITSIAVLDDLGRTMGQYQYISPVNRANISLIDLNAGVYFIRIKTENNQEITKKITKR